MSDTGTLLGLTAPKAGASLRAVRLVAFERISAPFRYEIDAVGDAGIDPVAMLNKPASVAIQNAGSVTRYLAGLVGEFGTMGPNQPAGTPYRMVIVPQLATLGHASDCRMFFGKTAEDILQTLFREGGVTSVEFRLTGTPVARPATAQFNEATLAFATRLMEEEGWFYFFEHSSSGDKLVVADVNTSFTTLAGITQRHGGIGTADVLDAWREPNALTRGQVSLADYDPDAPSKKLSGQQPTVLKHDGATMRELFHWPALTNSTSTIGDLAKFRMEADECRAVLSEGAGTCAALVAGGKFTYADPSGNSIAMVVREIRHEATDDLRQAGTGSESYSNRFSAFPNSVPWRETMGTGRPRMEGLHTALVLGPAGDEIHTDEQGRVKIKFFWDWRGDATADVAPFVRVVQPWAGNGWGGQFIPRVGTEVAVTFMDADPDRPVVIGGFYNGTDKPIFAVADQNKLGFRSRSTKQGANDGFNELSLDDTKDSEVFFVHAQKDLTTEVENNETLTVDKDRTKTVKGKETATITGDRTHEVSQGNEALTVKQGNRTVEVTTGNESLTVKTGDRSVEVTTGNDATAIKQGNQTVELMVGNQTVTLDIGNQTTEAKLGNISIKADAGSITLEALQGVTLKCGANSVALSPTGIEIKGMMVTVEGQMMTSVKGLMVQTQGEAMLTLKGGITMIN